VSRYLADKGLRLARFEHDAAFITSADGEEIGFGLLNIAQLCSSSPPESWQVLISEHISTALGGLGEAGAFEFTSYEALRHGLKLRLYEMSDVTRRAVTWTPLAGIHVTLVCETKNAIITVPADQARRWKKSKRELYEVALQNTKARRNLELLSMETPGGVRIQWLCGDDFFVSSQVLFLDEYVTPTEHGAIVSVPMRQVVLFYPIEDLRVVKAVDDLLPITFGNYQEGPGSVSPNLYWWRNGRFTLLTRAIPQRHPGLGANPGFVIDPPRSFVKLVQRLQLEAKAANRWMA
jgi:hypothetical protein